MALAPPAAAEAGAATSGPAPTYHFFAWQPALEQLAEPFYAAVWLVGHEFAHSSEVTIGIRQSIERHLALLGEPALDGPPLPAEYQELPGADKLVWQTYPWHILVDSFDYPNGWPAWALEKPHYLCEPEDNDAYLMVQTGWQWVGMLPTTTYPSAPPETSVLTP